MQQTELDWIAQIPKSLVSHRFPSNLMKTPALFYLIAYVTGNNQFHIEPH